MQKKKIAIIGCGTGGMAAACFLTQDGHAVTLFEKFESAKPIGAGLLLQPTGLACLAHPGLDRKIIAEGSAITHLHGRSVTGTTIFDVGYGKLGTHLFGLGIHRGSLFNTLYDEVQRLGIPVKTHCDIRGVQAENGMQTISDAEGNEYGPFDLVIDSSGRHSPLRERYADIKLNKPYPYAAVWGVCEDAGGLFEANRLQQRYDAAKVMIGLLPVGHAPGRQNRHIAFFWSLPAVTYEAWRERGIDAWKTQVLDYWPEIEPLVAQFKTVDDLTFAQYGDTVLKTPLSGRLVFIGDAAHSTSPQLGQGANLAIIDAMMLAKTLRATENLDAALTAYVKARHAHVRFYQTASRWLTPFFQSESTLAAKARDLSFGLMCKTPYINTEMVRTLSGMKTGLFTHLDPGAWSGNYSLKRRKIQ